RQLTLEAEQARSVRDPGRLGAAAVTLLEVALPLGLEAVAYYYKACAVHNDGHAPQDALGALTESAIPTIRGRAELALGCGALRVLDHTLAARHFDRAEAAFDIANCVDPVGVLQLRKSQAHLWSDAGDHARALRYLQESWQLARRLFRVLPAIAYDLLNSIAIELSALGNREPAVKLICAATESPFVVRYPVWSD